MSRVYKPLVYKTLPGGAELFTRKGQRFAKWTDKRGRMRTAPVAVPERGAHTGQPRIVVESGRYIAEYRDADGKHSVPTGCATHSGLRNAKTGLSLRGCRPTGH